MAIARALAHVLLEWADDEPFSGAVLQLGRQRVYLTGDELAGHGGGEAAAGRRRFVTDTEFFGALGFTSVESCDVVAADEPTYVLDLQDPVPDGVAGRYEMVFDGGTLEHILDVPAVLANIHRLLRVGGRVVHVSPMSNYADHGFYSFSPTFFADYYGANGWEVERIAVLEHSRRWARSRWHVWEYQPGALDRLAIGGLERHAYLVLAIARKTVAATASVRVSQGAARRDERVATPRLGRSGLRSRVASSMIGRRVLVPLAVRLSPILPTRVIPFAPRRWHGRHRRY